MVKAPDTNRFADNIEDAVTFPLLTHDVGGSLPSRSAARPGSLTQTAQQTIRDVLGWRYRDQDSKGFLAALGKAFSLREVEGHTEWQWHPQSFMLQADLGEITGAQASIYQQAKVVLDQALPLLDGLVPLRPDVDPEDAESLRAIIRTELRELTAELGAGGGPRVQRVDLFFIGLLGPAPRPDPEEVAGQLQRLRTRFGLERERVNTIVEEQNYTNFIILVDYLNGLHQSWQVKRPYFTRGAGPEPFLGTQLVLLSQALDVILEQVNETYGGMDSVFFGAGERQTTLLELPNEPPITVAELLGWVEGFAAGEGRTLLAESGKDGVVLFRQTLERLSGLVGATAQLSATPSDNPARAFHTKRVAVMLDGLASQLESATELASGIRRRPPVAPSSPGAEENVALQIPPFVSSGVAPRVDKLELEGIGEEADDDESGKLELSVNGYAELRIYGAGLRGAGLVVEVGKDVEIESWSFRSSELVVLTLKVGNNAIAGPRDVSILSGGRLLHRERRAYSIAALSSPTILVGSVSPAEVAQGERLTIEIKGEHLEGASVTFGDGITVVGLTYDRLGLKVVGLKAEIEVDERARLGERRVDVFAPGRTMDADTDTNTLKVVRTAALSYAFVPIQNPLDRHDWALNQHQSSSPPSSQSASTAVPKASELVLPAVRDEATVREYSLADERIRAALKTHGNLKKFHSLAAPKRIKLGRKTRELSVSTEGGPGLRLAFWLAPGQAPIECATKTHADDSSRSELEFELKALASSTSLDLWLLTLDDVLIELKAAAKYEP